MLLRHLSSPLFPYTTLFRSDYKVWHYTELLAHLIETRALEVEPLGLQVTYHDPCYLARYNKVTEAPRRILAALGCELVERSEEHTSELQSQDHLVCRLLLEK